MTRHDHPGHRDPLDVAVRGLDPASRPDPYRSARPTAQATLERILDTPPAPVARPERPSPRRRLVALGVAASATAGLAVGVSALLGGGPAYASWTSTGTPLSATAADEAAGECRSLQVDLRSHDAEAWGPSAGQIRAGEVSVAERRGDWTLVVLRIGSYTGTCLLGADDPMVAMSPDVPAAGPLAPSSFGSGSTAEGGMGWVTGDLPDGVRSVSVESADRTLQATVSDDAYAAWWPDATASGADPITLTATYADGHTETRTVEPPTVLPGAPGLGGDRLENADAVSPR